MGFLARKASSDARAELWSCSKKLNSAGCYVSPVLRPWGKQKGTRAIRADGTAVRVEEAEAVERRL